MLQDESPQRDPQESAELSLRRERIQAALTRLPPDQRQAVTLAYFGGLTQTQIAAALQQPLGTIKTRVRLAMQKLRDVLREEHGSEDKSVAAQHAYNISKEE
jgi:RNA polymerase sigma-70 factor (ECF subfamily)